MCEYFHEPPPFDSLLGKKEHSQDATASCSFLSGAEGGSRTRDLPLTKRLLYQLSYLGMLCMLSEYSISTTKHGRAIACPAASFLHAQLYL